MIVHINQYGHVVDEKNSDYKVYLTGSYYWCCVAKMWSYEVEKIEPELQLSRILLKEKL